MNSILSFSDCIDTSPLDPTKHVNFVQGMVLGEDDFRQEFAWHAGRHALIARELAGYGTVSGLKLTLDGKRTMAPVVSVEPGLAVTPAGQFARIKRRQCANVGEWLARPENRSRAPSMLGSPGTLGVIVYARLRYDTCLVDQVPIPGEPCRTEEEAMAASRVADSWKLQLSFDPPAQHEEDAVRELVHWLRRLTLVEHPAASPAQVVQELRKSAESLLAASDAPRELELGEPPLDFFVARADLCECVRAALLVWTTELRPRVQERWVAADGGCGCVTDGAASPPSSATPEQDVMLGELWVPVRDTLGGLELDTSVDFELHEERRPYLLSLRMVQELVSCGPDATGAIELRTFATLLAETDSALLLWLHHPQELDIAGDGALMVSVNDVPVTELTIAPVLGAPGVFALGFDGSLPTLLHPGDRVALSFDIDATRERATGRTLREALDESTTGYLDRVGNAILVHTIVGPLALDDLIDVDAASAADDLVLTARNGRWSPEPVPRNLGELGDVDVDLVSPVNDQVLALEDGRWHAKLLDLDDLGDVDAAVAPEQHVLTAHDGRWRPEAIPRNLAELGDVDVDLVSLADGQVLTLRHGRWEPNLPNVPNLRDLGDVSIVGAPALDEVLTFDGSKWAPKAPAGPDPSAEVHSGLIAFGALKQGPPSYFGPFEHGFDKERVVMIRLALLSNEQVEEQEDTDSLANLTGLRMVVLSQRGTGQFLIALENTLPTPVKFIVRWFAVPVTRNLGRQEAKQLSLSEVRDADLRTAILGHAVRSQLALKNTALETIAAALGITADELRGSLPALGFKLDNGRIVPLEQ